MAVLLTHPHQHTQEVYSSVRLPVSWIKEMSTGRHRFLNVTTDADEHDSLITPSVAVAAQAAPTCGKKECYPLATGNQVRTTPGSTKEWWKNWYESPDGARRTLAGPFLFSLGLIPRVRAPLSSEIGKVVGQCLGYFVEAPEKRETGTDENKAMRSHRKLITDTRLRRCLCCIHSMRVRCCLDADGESDQAGPCDSHP